MQLSNHSQPEARKIGELGRLLVWLTLETHQLVGFCHEGYWTKPRLHHLDRVRSQILQGVYADKGWVALTVNTLSTLQNIWVCIKFRYPCAVCYFYLNLEQKSRQTTANEMTGAVSSDELLGEQFLQFNEGVTEVTSRRSSTVFVKNPHSYGTKYRPKRLKN